MDVLSTNSRQSLRRDTRGGGARQAITIDAAYSWRREDDLCSVKVGKAATFTVLEVDPYEVDPTDLGDISVVGIVFQGHWSPVPENLWRFVSNQTAALTAVPTRAAVPGAASGHGECDEGGCSCTVARRLMQAYQAGFDPAAWVSVLLTADAAGRATFPRSPPKHV